MIISAIDAKGEDGGIASFSSSNLGSGAVTEGWSYQTALDSVGGNGAGVQRQNPPRMDVASLISAKRKSFLSQEKKHKNSLTSRFFSFLGRT